ARNPKGTSSAATTAAAASASAKVLRPNRDIPNPPRPKAPCFPSAGAVACLRYRRNPDYGAIPVTSTTATMRLTREQQQAATRERVLAAATTTFLEKGFHGTTIATVADTAGFTSGAIYSNFASKEDLVLAVLD